MRRPVSRSRFSQSRASGECQQGQRAAFALDLGEDLLDELVVLEAVAALRRRLDESASEVASGRRIEDA